jgi:hypothetical protein
MAYAKEVQILKGDIVYTPNSGTGFRPLTNNFLLTNHYGALDYWQVLNYVLTNASTQCHGGPTFGYVKFSPNGRYIIYNGTLNNNSNSTGVVILDLELNTVTLLSPTAVAFTGCFTEDSTTFLMSSSVSPFIQSIDLVTKTVRGTITGAPTLTSQSMKCAAYGSLIYFISRGTGATGQLYSYNPSTNSCSLLATHAFQFAHIAIDSIGYCYLANGSTGAGRGLNVYDLNSIGTTPAMATTLTNFFGSIAANENAVVSDNGIYFCGQGSILRAAKINYGANVTATTFTNISPTVNVDVDQGGTYTIKHVNNYVFFTSGTAATAPRYTPQLRICDVNGYTTGNVTAPAMPGLNSSIGGTFDVHPAFTKRKLAGTVLDASLAPVDREVIVIARDTGRLLATTTSSSVDGTFLIELYTTSPVIVLAKGEGAEVTKLVDNVVPVAP